MAPSDKSRSENPLKSLLPGGNGNGDIYTGIRSLKILRTSSYVPGRTPAATDSYQRFIKGAQCSANPTSPEHSGALRFLDPDWLYQANACSLTETAVSGVIMTSFNPSTVGFNGQIFGKSERVDDLFSGSYPLLWCRSQSGASEGIDVVIGEKILDSRPAGDASIALVFPSEASQAGLVFSRPETMPTATYVNGRGKIALAGIGEPRIDFDPTSKNILGLLIEDSRTNYAVENRNLEKWQRSTSAEVFVDATLAPDGNRTAEQVFTTTTAFIEHPVPDQVGSEFTFSIFAKRGAENFGSIKLSYETATSSESANFDLDNLLVRDASSNLRAEISRFSDWNRLQITFKNSSSSGRVRVSFSQGQDKRLYLWGSQLENGANASSVIFTAAAPVTRSKDSVRIDRTIFENSTGTLVIRFSPQADQGSGVPLALVGSGTVRAEIDSQKNLFLQNTNGSAVALGSLLGYNDIRIGFSVAAGKLEAAVSGAMRASDVDFSFASAITSVHIGSDEAGGNFVSGHLRSLYFWSRPLLTGTLVHETGSRDPLPLQGQISVGDRDSSGFVRSEVFNFQVVRDLSQYELTFVAPDYDFKVTALGTTSLVREFSGTLDVAIDGKLYRETVNCNFERENYR